MWTGIDIAIALVITCCATLLAYRTGLRRSLAVIEQDDDIEDSYSETEILSAILAASGNGAGVKDARDLARRAVALLRGD